VKNGILSEDDVKKITTDQFNYFASELQSVESYEPSDNFYFKKQWEGFVQPSNELTIWDTGLGWDLLSFVGRSSVHYPPNFVINIFKTLISIH
jgi:hypothetical protein